MSPLGHRPDYTIGQPPHKAAQLSAIRRPTRHHTYPARRRFALTLACLCLRSALTLPALDAGTALPLANKRLSARPKGSRAAPYARQQG